MEEIPLPPVSTPPTGMASEMGETRFTETPALHSAIEAGDISKLQELLSIQVRSDEDILLAHNGRTVLHYACRHPRKRTSTEMIRIILNSYHLRMNPDVASTLVNAQDAHDGSTALHVAARMFNREAVIVLLRAGADVNIPSKDGAQPITLIYKNVPNAILSIFDGGLTVKDESGDVDPQDEDLKVDANFGMFVGLHGPEDDKSLLISETDLIMTVITECPSHRSEVLLHPLVQLFLHYKWIKIKFLVWFSIFVHIFWSLLSATCFINMYVFTCPYDNRSRTNKFVKGTDAICEYSKTTYALNVVLFVLCVLLLIKEFYEIASSHKLGHYLRQKENLGQWILLITVMILTSDTAFFHDTVPGNRMRVQAWEYPVAALATFLAFTLICAQLCKYPRIGIYMEMLETVSARSLYCVLVYGSILVAFWTALLMLMPQKSEFGPYGFIKLVTMMTGESNYDDLFFGDDSDALVPFTFSTQLLFLGLALIVIIVLHNLLIGILVSDIEALQRDARVSNIRRILSDINLMESFILSPVTQKWLVKKDWLRRFLVTQQNEVNAVSGYRLVVAKQDDQTSSQEFITTVSLSDTSIPVELRRDIRRVVAQDMIMQSDNQSNPQNGSQMPNPQPEVSE